MTQTNADTITCPECGDGAPVALSDGTMLCLNCRNEWNPDDVPNLSAVVPPKPIPADTTEAAAAVIPPDPAAAPVPDAVDAILRPPDAVVAAWEAQAALDAMIGTDVILEGGQVARIVGFPDDDHAEVVIGAGTDTERTETVALNDVVRSVDAPPPVADVPDEVAAALAKVNLTVAGLVLKAGLATIDGEYPNAQLVTPPTGWLPLDADGMPALEQGTAYAIATLIHAFSMDRRIVDAIADTLINESQDTEPMKGGADQ